VSALPRSRQRRAKSSRVNKESWQIDGDSRDLMKESWKTVGRGGALIVLLTAVAYYPALRGGFVFDDSESVTGNRSLRTLEGLRRIWVDPHASFQYYPLTYTSFWVEYHLWGLRPAGYHAVNILLHTSNALLVGLLLARLAVPGAWLAALLFAVHPVHVESVAWISELKNVLSAFFYLNSLLAYLRFADGPKRRWGFYALSFALFLCALLGKTSAVSMPFAVLLVLWWKQERIKGEDALALIPFFLAGAALGLLTAWVEVHYRGAHGPQWQLSMLERCLVAGRVVWFYAGKLLWPHPLMIVYPRWQINTAAWWQYLYPCAAGAVILALGLCRKRLGKAPLAAVLFFAGSLAPIPAFINVGFMRYSYVADHWQYLSSIGLIALAAACVENLVQEKFAATGSSHANTWQPGHNMSRALAVPLLLVLVGLTWQQAGIYRDLETFWGDTLAKNPGAWMAHNNLGAALASHGKLSEATAEYAAALRINPDFAEAHNNLGLALAGQGRLAEATAEYTAALRLEPDFAEAHYNLGNALLQRGNLTEAAQHFEQAVRIKPDYAEAHSNLGNALLQRGNLTEAVQHFEQAVRIKPDYAEMHYNLAVVLIRQGNVREAVRQYEQVMRIKPDSAEVENNLAWLLATSTLADGGDPVRAVALAQHACELTGNRVPRHIDTLAAAYAAAGRFSEAIATAQKAIELARSTGQTQLVREIENRLQLYRDGRSYRLSAGGKNLQEREASGQR
jgi:tetratricopeptide (TPR) repeat protein